MGIPIIVGIPPFGMGLGFTTTMDVQLQFRLIVFGDHALLCYDKCELGKGCQSDIAVTYEFCLSLAGLADL